MSKSKSLEILGSAVKAYNDGNIHHALSFFQLMGDLEEVDVVASFLRYYYMGVKLPLLVKDKIDCIEKGLWEYERNEDELSSRIGRELNPIVSELYDNLGQLFFHNIKDFDKALDCFMKAIEYDPLNYLTALNIASVFAAEGDVENMLYFVGLLKDVEDRDATFYKWIDYFIEEDLEMRKNENSYFSFLKKLNGLGLISDAKFRIISRKIKGSRKGEDRFEFQVKINDLKEKIAMNKIDVVIDRLLELSKENKPLYNDLIIIKNNYIKNQSESRLGLLDSSVEHVQLNRIKKAILSIIDELSDS